MIKKNFISILIFLVFLTGVGLLLYPTFANWWNERIYYHAVLDYVDTLATTDADNLQCVLQEAKAYNQKIAQMGGNRFDDLNEAETLEYNRQLTTNDLGVGGVMGYIQIPTIEVTLPIYHGTEEAVLSAGIGHLRGTSLPVGGPSSHCILMGHRGLPEAELFTNLDQVKIGDTFILSVIGELFTYQVDQIQVVLPEDMSKLQIEENADFCTLITCTPYGVNSHRLLVRGTRISNAVSEDAVISQMQSEEQKGTTSMLMILLIVIVVLTVVFLLTFHFPFKPNKQLLGIVFILGIGLGVLENGISVHANDAAYINLNAKGSVNVTIYDTKSQKTVPGGKLKCTKVANIIETENEYEYEYTDDFSACEYAIDTGFSKSYAEQLSTYQKKQNINGIEQDINSQGTAQFENLSVGLYLIEQVQAAKGYSKINSFLVSIPYAENATYLYDVNATPKTNTVHKNTKDDNDNSDDGSSYHVEPPIEERNKDDKIPQTGQLWWPVSILAMSGLILLFIGIYCRRIYCRKRAS